MSKDNRITVVGPDEAPKPAKPGGGVEGRPSRDEAEAAVRTMIRWTGDDPDREGVMGTPARVVRAYEDFYAGYDQDPAAILRKALEPAADYDEMVLLKNIRVESHCEHHMVAIIGVAHVAYVPNETMVGISKLARVVEVFARRMQIQEGLTAQIANVLHEVLQPRGVGVVIDAEHQCMTTRGIHRPGMSTVTSKMIGCFKDDRERRRELFELIRGH